MEKAKVNASEKSLLLALFLWQTSAQPLVVTAGVGPRGEAKVNSEPLASFSLLTEASGERSRGQQIRVFRRGRRRLDC